MNSASADLRKNRLYVTLTDASRQGLQDLLGRIEAAVADLEPDFTCLTQLEVNGALLGENRDQVLQIQRFLFGLGLGKAVRVAAQEQLEDRTLETLNIVTSGYFADHVASCEEAERLLDAYRKEAKRFRRKARREKALFKVMEQGGWEDDLRFDDFNAARQRLNALRASGRKNAIIVDAGISARPRGLR